MTSTDPAKVLRTGLIGCGRIGANTRDDLKKRLGANWLPLSHLDAAIAIPALKVTAVCDVDQAAAVAAADKTGYACVYTDPSAMFGAETLDILMIATRADHRSALINQAIENNIQGIHAEKPLGQSVKEVDSTIKSLKRADICFTYGALRRYMGIYRDAQARVIGGAIGEFEHLDIQFGLGGLLWVHPHSVDLIGFFFYEDQPEQVKADFHDLTTKDINNNCLDRDPVLIGATIRFSSGRQATISPVRGLNMIASGTEGQLAVLGDGSLIVESNHLTGSEFKSPETWRMTQEKSSRSGRLTALGELVEAVKSQTVDTALMDNIFQQQRILSGFVQSHLAGGGWISLDDVDQDLRITGAQNGLAA
ncbi:MAG: Gfo/Idh/MocA family oxidoreductase [Pseudomonadota bacterium]